MKDMIKESV